MPVNIRSILDANIREWPHVCYLRSEDDKWRTSKVTDTKVKKSTI